jgi:hypothetical protein
MALRADAQRHHARPAPLRELHRVLADPARGAGHQHGLAGDGAIGEEAAVGGHRRDAEAGPVSEADAVRQAHGVAGGHDNILGRGAEGPLPLGLVEPDPLAHPRRLDAGADRVDNPRAVLVGDDPRKGHLGLAAPGAAALGVGRVDGGDGEADAHLTGAGLGDGQLAHGEHLAGGPLALIPGRAHRRGVCRSGHENENSSSHVCAVRYP